MKDLFLTTPPKLRAASRIMEAVNGSRCLKVTVLTYQPYLMVLGRAPHWRFVGMLTIVLDILAQHLGFCFEYLVPNDSMFGDLLDNGTITGQVALLNRS
ncbi:putative Glutamate receptor 2-like 17, partial [Homarus americanus]